MPTDTRDRNSYFYRKDITKYLLEYAGAIASSLNKVDGGELEKARRLLLLTLSSNGRIFVGGNGGSSSISDHLCCDWEKGTHHKNTNSLMVHHLGGSPSLFSAIANDMGYDETLAFPLELSRLDSRDTVVLISSSGNSPNILKAMNFAHSRNASVIGMTGFDGGALKKGCDISLHIPFNNYGVVEDCHQALMHVLAQFHYLSLNE